MTTVTPRTWDEEADLVVVGFGGSGATCAAVAAEAGADVLVLEKGTQGGGNSACIAGSLVLSVEDRDKSFEYLDWMCGGQTPAEVINAYLDGLSRIRNFQLKLGFEIKDDPRPFRNDGFYPEFPEAPGAGGLLGNSYIKAPGGDALWTAISERALSLGARLLTETPVKDLVQDPETGTVLGVIAQREDGSRITVRGRKATVLATGGFEFNEQMRRQFLSHCPSLFLGSKNLTGDGILMAQRAGARLWHMNSAAGPLYWGIKTDNDDVYVTYEFMRLAGFGYRSPVFAEAGSLIWVNKNGRRFVNETIEIGSLHHGYANRPVWMAEDVHGAEFVNVPAFQIFDEKVRRAGPAMTTLNSRTPRWSADNLAEIDRGLVIKADTLEELASRCVTPRMPGVCRGGTIDAAALVKTIEAWNDAARRGADGEFGREDYLVPIDTPPFYAIGPMVPTYVNTHGGPEHDARQRVLDTEGHPIPRLYAVGECGSIWGPYYNSMGDICEFLISGMNAAKAALAETSDS